MVLSHCNIKSALKVSENMLGQRDWVNKMYYKRMNNLENQKAAVALEKWKSLVRFRVPEVYM